MAHDAADRVVHYLATDEAHRDDLYRLRHWTNLAVGTEGKSLWVKGFDYAQVHSPVVRSLPHQLLYYENGGKLFRLGSQLPDRSAPTPLWTPIGRALPLRLPGFNHHYFGIDQTVPVTLVPSDTEREATALLTTLDALRTWLPGASAARLRPLRWAILPPGRAFVGGQPLLPLPGQAYWQRDDLVLPAGLDLELPALADLLNARLNPAHDGLVVWQPDGTWFRLAKTDLQPLSRGSFRRSEPVSSAQPNH